MKIPSEIILSIGLLYFLATISLNSDIMLFTTGCILGFGVILKNNEEKARLYKQGGTK